MTARPWACEVDVPASARVDGGIWEPADATPGANNQIMFAPDRWGVRPMGQPTSANQPYRGDREGFPAFVWPNTRGNRGVRVTDNFTPRYWVFVMAYNDSALSAFLGDPGIVYGDTNNRVRGRNGANTLRTRVSKNCANPAEPVLPMSMSIIEWFPAAATLPWGLMGDGNNGWQGPIWFAMALGEVPSDELRSMIQGSLAWRFNRPDLLPTTHQFRNAAPVVAAAQPVEARGAAQMQVRAGGRVGLAVSAKGGAGFRLGAYGRARVGIAARGRAAVHVQAAGRAGVGIAGCGGAGLTLGGSGRAGLALSARGSAALRLLAGGAAVVLDAPITIRGRIATVGQSRSATDGLAGRRTTAGNDGRRSTRET